MIRLVALLVALAQPAWGQSALPQIEDPSRFPVWGDPGAREAHFAAQEEERLRALAERDTAAAAAAQTPEPEPEPEPETRAAYRLPPPDVPPGCHVIYVSPGHRPAARSEGAFALPPVERRRIVCPHHLGHPLGGYPVVAVPGTGGYIVAGPKGVKGGAYVYRPGFRLRLKYD